MLVLVASKTGFIYSESAILTEKTLSNAIAVDEEKGVTLESQEG